jgi:Protein of unknown function (DUF2442)
MTFLPSVIRAEYRGGFRIHLTFHNQSERTLDFRPWLEGPVFEALRDPAHFREFFVDGGTVAWPNGADVAPETLYEAAASHPARGKHPQRRAKARVRRGTARTRGDNP